MSGIEINGQWYPGERAGSIARFLEWCAAQGVPPTLAALARYLGERPAWSDRRDVSTQGHTAAPKDALDIRDGREG